MLPNESVDLGQGCRPRGLLCLLSLIHVLIRRNVPVVIIICFSYYSTQLFFVKLYKRMPTNIPNPLLCYCVYMLSRLENFTPNATKTFAMNLESTGKNYLIT